MQRQIISSFGQSSSLHNYRNAYCPLPTPHCTKNMPKKSFPKKVDASQTQCSCIFLTLAEGTIHSILSYAAPRYQRAHLLCQLGLTCHSMSLAVRDGFHLVWKAIHLQDYGAANPAVSRRTSKRLCRSPKANVKASHMAVIERTLFAHAWMIDWATSKKTPLTLNRLRWALREFEPLVNYRVGTTLLIECCRADVKDSVILRCVRELIENFGADPNVAAITEQSSFHGVTPLIIASARGIPCVVRYLLDAGASPLTVGNARFSWVKKSTRTVKGAHTPLEFARGMREAEIAQWGDDCDYDSPEELDECIEFLEEAENATRQSKRAASGCSCNKQK